MAKKILYYSPESTLEIMKAVNSGMNNVEKIAKKIDNSPSTIQNKIHDPSILDLIESENGEYEITEGGRKIVQLKEKSILKERFLKLPGVEDILNKLKSKEKLNSEEIGRRISFEAKSGASKKETYRSYGKIYGKWFDHLELGYYSDAILYSDKDDIDKKKNISVAANPDQVFEAVKTLNKANNRKELADRLGYSVRFIEKILSTIYALDIADYSSKEFKFKERGNKIVKSSIGEKKKIMRNALIELPLVKAYINMVSEDDVFKNKEIVKNISNQYMLGWSERTIETRARRLYPWLIFTELCEEEEPGLLSATEKLSEL